MDDNFESVRDLPTAQRLTDEIDKVISEGGFKTKGWLSNRSLTDSVQKEGEMRLLEALAEEKVLGAVWDNSKDVFSYRVKIDLQEYSEGKPEGEWSLSKRMIFSQ